MLSTDLGPGVTPDAASLGRRSAQCGGGFKAKHCNLVVQNGAKYFIRDQPSITSSKRWVGGVRKWQFLMIYSTVNHQRVGWVGLKKSKT